METKQLIVEIAEDLHRKLKIISAEKGVPIKHLMIRAIEEIIKKETK
jgi:predicted HicB family RNase H-like nuclease